MAKIAILSNWFSKIDGEQYEVDTDRKSDGYEKGDLLCYVHPFFGVPLRLDIAIRANGQLAFRSWSWGTNENNYLHTYAKPEDFTATPEQIDTVNGLFSGRIRFEGLKLAVGGTVQHVCPIDVAKEEKLTDKKIFLA